MNNNINNIAITIIVDYSATRCIKNNNKIDLAWWNTNDRSTNDNSKDLSKDFLKLSKPIQTLWRHYCVDLTHNTKKPKNAWYSTKNAKNLHKMLRIGRFPWEFHAHFSKYLYWSYTNPNAQCTSIATDLTKLAQDATIFNKQTSSRYQQYAIPTNSLTM
jgi:hypothetical protein